MENPDCIVEIPTASRAVEAPYASAGQILAAHLEVFCPKDILALATRLAAHLAAFGVSMDRKIYHGVRERWPASTQQKANELCRKRPDSGGETRTKTKSQIPASVDQTVS